MKELPTAEEFLIRQGCQRMDCEGEDCDYFEDVQPKDLIEFAQLHVQAALESVVENGKVRLANDWVRKQETIHPNSLVGSITIKVDEESVLNAYPLDNIK